MSQFDSLVRGKLLGYTSAFSLAKSNSCILFLHSVKVPVMFLLAKDDPITMFSSVPIDDLYRNENFSIAMMDAGGHCEFYYTDIHNNTKRLTPTVVLQYFDLVRQS